MGYACPVCEDPQADAGHLANHLAFTAILGDDAHGAWLDEHAPGWGEMDEAELAVALRDSVEETEFPQVFEDTVGGLSEPGEPSAERSGALFDDGSPGDGHDHVRGGDHGRSDRRDGATPAVDVPDVAGVDTADPADEETAAILEEAREMTRKMRGEAARDDGVSDATDERPDGTDDSPYATDERPDADGDGGSDPDTEGDGEDADAGGEADGNENG